MQSYYHDSDDYMSSSIWTLIYIPSGIKNLIFSPFLAHSWLILSIYYPSFFSKKLESLTIGYFWYILISGIRNKEQVPMIAIWLYILLGCGPTILSTKLDKTTKKRSPISISMVRKCGKYVLSMANKECRFSVFWKLNKMALSFDM